MIKKKKKSKGSVLVFTLIILFIILAAAISVAAVAVIERKTSMSTGDSAAAFQIADGGAEIFFKAIKDKGCDASISSVFTGCGIVSIPLNNGSYGITFYDTSGNPLGCDKTLGDVDHINSVGTYKQTVRAAKINVSCEPEDYTTGLVAHWALNEGAGTIAHDSIGGQYGTLINGTSWTSRVISTTSPALSFDGSPFPNTDYVKTTSNFLQSADNFTITLWFKTNSVTKMQHIIWEGDNGGSGWGDDEEMNLSIGDGSVTNRLSFFYGYGTTGVHYVKIPPVDFNDINKWHFVAVTASNLSSVSLPYPRAEMYLDNGSSMVSVGSATASSNVNPHHGWSEELWFGKCSITTGVPLDGAIDDVRIYGKVLDSGQINQIYNYTK